MVAASSPDEADVVVVNTCAFIDVARQESVDTILALDGAQRGGVRSAMRHAGFVHPPLSSKPAFRPDGDWYPPSGIPAPTLVNTSGDARPEIVAAVPDGSVYAIGPTGKRLWR